MIEPLTRKRPAAQPRTNEGEAPTAYVFQDVLEEIRFNGGYSPRQIAGGLLFGRHFKCDEWGSSYVEVAGFVAATHCGDVPGFINHFRTQWKSAGATLRYQFPDDEVVGWFLAAPEGFTPESTEQMDQDVYLLHSTFLQQPWQVGLWVQGKESPPLALSRMSGRLHSIEAALVRRIPTP
ncbi:MAG: hypothetical protein ACE366_05235 [Bradymonadia bacterium]